MGIVHPEVASVLLVCEVALRRESADLRLRSLKCVLLRGGGGLGFTASVTPNAIRIDSSPRFMRTPFLGTARRAREKSGRMARHPRPLGVCARDDVSTQAAAHHRDTGELSAGVWTLPGERAQRALNPGRPPDQNPCLMRTGTGLLAVATLDHAGADRVDIGMTALNVHNSPPAIEPLTSALTKPSLQGRRLRQSSAPRRSARVCLRRLQEHSRSLGQPGGLLSHTNVIHAISGV